MPAMRKITAMVLSLALALVWLPCTTDSVGAACPAAGASGTFGALGNSAAGLAGHSARLSVDGQGIPIVYTFEELVAWLGAEDILPDDEPFYDCGCAWDCSDGCACGESCGCVECGCDCNPDPPGYGFWPCGCDMFCGDDCVCGEGCECGEDCGCYCSPESGEPGKWPCGCDYYCDECVCGEICDCGEGCYCDCSPALQEPQLWPCGCPYDWWEGCACGEGCDCGQDCGCACNPWANRLPCGCELFCSDGCACGEECLCDSSCLCDCQGAGLRPAKGSSVRFGADIVAAFDSDRILEIEGIHIFTGTYGLIARSGTVLLSDGATASGEGVAVPVVTVEDGAGLTLHDATIKATGNAQGAGGVALLLEEGVELLQYDSAVLSSGSGAVAVRALGDLAVNTDSGINYGVFIGSCAPFSVRAEGADSTAIVAGGGVSLLYCDLSAGGQAIRAAGEILLDTCAVTPAVAGARVVRRTIAQASAFSGGSFFHRLGEPFVDEATGQDAFAAEYDGTFIAAADGAEHKWVTLRYRLGAAELDLDTPGSYFVPMVLQSPFDRFFGADELRFRAAVYVMHPDIPYFREVEPYEIDGEKFALFTLTGAGLDMALHTLLVSLDEGETWQAYPWEQAFVSEGAYLSLPVDGQNFPATFQISTPAGMSNQIRTDIHEDGYFISGPPVGDRIGDQGGNQNPPAEPEPQPPAEPEPPPAVPDPPAPVEPDPPATGGTRTSADGSGERDTDRASGVRANPPQVAPVTLEPEPAYPPQPPDDPGPAGDTNDPAALEGVAFTGAQLRALMAAKPEQVVFRHGDVQVWLPTEALRLLQVGGEDVFAVRMEYRRKERLTVLLTVNNRSVSLSAPFLAAVPWDGEEVVCKDADGVVVPVEYDSANGLLLLTLPRPGDVFFSVAAAEDDVAAQAGPPGLPVPPLPRDSGPAEEGSGSFPVVLAGVFSVGGLGGLTVFWRRRRRK